MRTLIPLRKLILVSAAGGLAFYGALHHRDSTADDRPANPRAQALPVSLQKHSAIGGLASVGPKPAAGLLSPEREHVAAEPAGNLFAARSWLPPPPPPVPVKAAPPPPPQAPPLPFGFVGMLEDRAKPTAFLSKGDALLIVSAGDTLEGTYRVDAVSPQEIALTYLPLNQQQHIRISGEL